MKIKALMILTMVLGLAFAAQAQTSRGTVAGTITDSNGAVVSGATVTLTNTDTNLSRTAETNDSGFYRFDAVDLGNYSVTVTAPGFGTINTTGVAVSANQTTAVDAQLAQGGQTVT